MYTEVLALAVGFMLSGAGQSRGVVTAVSVEAPAGQTAVVVTVRGNNPCGAVTMEYGDGTRVTYPITGLPATLSYQYTRAGTHRVRAIGTGNCDGQVDTTIDVRPTHVRAPDPEPAPSQPPARRVAAMDAMDLDRNGHISREEWNGTEAAFRRIDENGDGALSLTEAEDGAFEVFASLDLNDDRRISTREWRSVRQSFGDYDRNGDGFISEGEFGVEPAAAGRSAAAKRGGGVAAPRGKPMTVVVRASQAWSDTGIMVQAGDLLTFRATGTIRMGLDAADVATPRGAQSGRQAANAPLPDALAGALIARVGDSAPILIGDQTGPVRMPRTGRLFLGTNDDHVDDNNGEFRVAIAVAR